MTHLITQRNTVIVEIAVYETRCKYILPFNLKRTIEYFNNIKLKTLHKRLTLNSPQQNFFLCLHTQHIKTKAQTTTTICMANASLCYGEVRTHDHKRNSLCTDCYANLLLGRYIPRQTSIWPMQIFVMARFELTITKATGCALSAMPICY